MTAVVESGLWVFLRSLHPPACFCPTLLLSCFLLSAHTERALTVTQCLCECIYDIGILSEMGQAIWVMGVGSEGVGWVEKFYYSGE